MRFPLRVRRLTGLLLLAPTGAAAQMAAPSAPDVGDSLPTDPAVTIGTLPNGMRYYLRQNAEPEKRAELRLVVDAGSVLEDDDQRGLAHFLEHMAFNGTKNFEKQELVDYMESIGMRFGGDVNASTTYDHTLYRLTVPTATAGALETGLQILEDWAHGITLDEAAIEAERGVILSEWRSRLGAGTRVRTQTDSVLLRGSRYLDRNPIGVPASIESMSRDEFVQFYRDWYRPDLMAVVVVGDIDVAATESLIRRHFSRIDAPRKRRQRPEYTVPDHETPLVSVVTDPEATGWSVQVVRKYRPAPVNSTARTREATIEGLYERILDQRLRELGTRAESPFLGARTDFGDYVGDLRVHTVVAVTVREQQLESGLQAAMTEVERIAQHGITAAELDREKRAAKSRYDQALITRSKIPSSSRAASYVEHFLTGATPAAVEAAVERASAVLETITREDVAAVARRWRERENMSVIALVPQKPDVTPPDGDALLAVLDAVEATELPAQGDAVVASKELLATLPTPGTVTQESLIREVGITEWTLSNGIKVYLKPTDHSPDQILLGGHSWGGTSLVSDEELLEATLAGSLPGISGLGDFSSTALRSATVGKLVSAGMQIGTYSQQVSGSSTVRDLETLLQLVHMHFTAPRLDTGAVRAWQRRLRTQLEGRSASPQTHFRDSVGIALAQNHPRGRPLRAEQVDSIDIGRALEIYRERFASPGDFTFVIVGSFQLDSIKPLVARYLGGLPAVTRDEGWRDTGMRFPTGVVEKDFRFGREPRSRTAIVFTGPFTHSAEEQFALGAMGQVLTARLRERLREDLGGTYSVSAHAMIHSVPERSAMVEISFDAAPERADELTKEVFAEIEALRKSGPTKEEVDKVREESTRSLELAVENNRYWLSSIMSYVQMERSLDGLADYEAPVERLDAAQIREMARQYLDPSRYVRVTQRPAN